jgi:putative membrane protein
MIKNALLCGALAVVAVGAVACEDTMMNDSRMSSMTQSGMAMSNIDYVTAAAESDQFEIQTGQLASRSGNPRLRDMGQMLVRDHMMTTRTLMDAARRSGMPPMPPPPLRPDHQQIYGQLQGMGGPDFDRMFTDQQVQAHQEALSLHSSYAGAGGDPNLRGAAQAAVPVVRQHLDMARQMQGMMTGR